MQNHTTPSRRRAVLIAATVAAVVTTGSGAAFGVTAANAATPATTQTAPASATPSTTTSGTTTSSSTTNGSTTTAATPSDGSDLAFTEPSTKTAPLALTATVGTPFSHTFHTTGGNGTVAYAIQDAPSSDYTVNVETGVLSGTPPTAGTFDFEVVALSGSTQVTEYVRLTVAAAPLAFTEPSSASSPLELTATAGTPFSHVFHVTGGTTTPAFALVAPAEKGLEVNLDGTLTSSITTAGVYSFRVTALSGSTQVYEYVRLTVRPAAPVGVLVQVTTGKPGDTAYLIEPNGTIEAFSGTGKSLGTVTSIPARQGSSLNVNGLAVDRYGNVTVPLTADGLQPATVTSSVASDQIVPTPANDSARVTFVHASQHRLTVTQDGVSNTFVVSVTPVATAAVATTSTGTGATLAYTGADERGPIGWALGLLAAGGTLLAYRLRRRRG